MSIIRIHDVSICFKGHTKPALNHLHYIIEDHDFVIVLGSNGSGKSTLLKLLYRLYQPDSGEIYFQNQPLQKLSQKTFTQKVRVLTQNYADSLFESLTLYENFKLVCASQNFKLPKHQSERQFLVHYLDDFNPHLGTKLDDLVSFFSGGEKQALALAFCLLTPPVLLLLDEHTSALDPKTSQQLMQLTQTLIKKHKITCLLTTHNLDIALQYGNRILILREGELDLTFDKKPKTLTREDLIKHYY